MKIIETSIPDLLVLEPAVFGDSRGFFMESFNQQIFENAIGKQVNFVQDNHSKSVMGVLRGLHYQLNPCAQGKLVRCTVGEVFDVAVDLRKDSPTFKQWVGVTLSAENKRQFWIPEGFAHGFLVTSTEAEFLYKTTDYYAPEVQKAIAYNDPTLNIAWPEIGIDYILSAKDKDAVLFESLKVQDLF
ncbi:TPA: dTDP-4-dehydrorhamnose 3,5-epimerase [Citrobacter freundii]|uniref:dTDP-4-dehydrorhamnose 3,5-epimerase n=1 Tax=Citrobacter TaxID=544 RepID=UPI001891D30C|nr:MULTISPECIES: dTDP-4-dehydrorhamnose 3,5-epimerase [Citrobacter]MCR3708043.1 dTDP-4-dehydrorhamnose 3,5-epimerase [Citrobacter freundii]MCY3449895.1 dTDP-4-dehydrorhamnose 3,5-epimerase [Citrobacter freundii]MDM3162562.1 dTDP-4-dehydrorhamnose 3,5-epimerase [Citrobacter sp. Cf118]MDM3222996.1 dTDP-4-dehydrorhamnose 3,5-epimerase [Citrobacter sp. Cf088]MEB1072082.1 dTDP-4-dehydrorhamnose 3,5-epimerase [Citrobacter freundii]